MPSLTRLLGILLLLLATAASPAPARAAEQHSKGQAKSDFEHVHALAMDAEGRSLYLGTHSGLYRSEDRGKTWQPVALPTKHGHLDIMALGAHPKDPRALYVATHEAGVFRTQDGGASWTDANAGLGGPDVHGLAFDPSDPRKLHAAVRGKGEGVYRTTDFYWSKDAGATWTAGR
jgi:photosystem II stability/assembly factor-like uncharacterized protein